jgi:periplasmic protein TonB
MSLRQRKTDAADLRKRYLIFVQLGMVASLILLIVLFTISLRAENPFEMIEEDMEVVQIEEIEQTRQIERPPPPPQPPPPVEVPDDQVEDMPDLDLDMELDLSAAPPAPPPPPPPPSAEPTPPPSEPEIFVIVEQQAEPIGGIEGIQQRARYPEMARRAGIEGTAFVQFVVNEDGSVQDLVCVRDPGGGTCESAIEAIRQTRFNPGRQRGRAVRVRMSLPVRFRLR